MRSNPDKTILLIFLVVVIGIFLINLFTPQILWHGNKEWTLRRKSSDIAESKRRGVFVKQMSFTADTTLCFSKNNIEFFIERGYTYGKRSENETHTVTGTAYTYQLVYPTVPETNTRIFLNSNDRVKFDSSSINWGYLKEPHLTDTLYFRLKLPNRQTEHILKVWEPQ